MSKTEKRSEFPNCVTIGVITKKKKRLYAVVFTNNLKSLYEISKITDSIVLGQEEEKNVDNVASIWKDMVSKKIAVRY